MRRSRCIQGTVFPIIFVIQIVADSEYLLIKLDVTEFESVHEVGVLWGWKIERKKCLMELSGVLK